MKAIHQQRGERVRRKSDGPGKRTWKTTADFRPVFLTVLELQSSSASETTGSKLASTSSSSPLLPTIRSLRLHTLNELAGSAASMSSLERTSRPLSTVSFDLTFDVDLNQARATANMTPTRLLAPNGLVLERHPDRLSWVSTTATVPVENATSAAELLWRDPATDELFPVSVVYGQYRRRWPEAGVTSLLLQVSREDLRDAEQASNGRFRFSTHTAYLAHLFFVERDAPSGFVAVQEGKEEPQTMESTRAAAMRGAFALPFLSLLEGTHVNSAHRCLYTHFAQCSPCSPAAPFSRPLGDHPLPQVLVSLL